MTYWILISLFSLANTIEVDTPLRNKVLIKMVEDASFSKLAEVHEDRDQYFRDTKIWDLKIFRIRKVDGVVVELNVSSKVEGRIQLRGSTSLIKKVFAECKIKLSKDEKYYRVTRRSCKESETSDTRDIQDFANEMGEYFSEEGIPGFELTEVKESEVPKVSVERANETVRESTLPGHNTPMIGRFFRVEKNGKVIGFVIEVWDNIHNDGRWDGSGETLYFNPEGKLVDSVGWSA